MKNFEAVIFTAIVLTLIAALASAEVPAVVVVNSNVNPISSVQAQQPSMQVVVIKAKRLSAAEKAALN